jgi:hypothetical protein
METQGDDLVFEVREAPLVSWIEPEGLMRARRI